MAREFRQVSSDFIKLDKENPSVEGILLEVLDMPVQGRTRVGLLIQSGEGLTAKVLKVPLGESMRGELSQLVKGNYYRVTYTGSVPTAKGNDAKKFKIEEAIDD